MQSCLRCHEEPIELPSGRTIPSVRHQIEGKAHVHGPLAQGNCTACHEPHASDHWRLLKDEYPSEFYAPFTEERYHLCFQCHDDALVLAAENRFATGFRDGNRNLHSVHVRREDKGRSCRACHEMHASDLPFQLRESVPFGQWELPIQFEQLENGGRCTPGCHAIATYDRGKE
jgi:predicted CXXCH cytochrome family protein